MRTPRHNSLDTKVHLVTLGVLLALFACLTPVAGASDVTDETQLTISRAARTSRTQAAYNVSITNTSANPLYGPLTVEVPTVSPSTVNVGNADGVGTSGMPYFDYSSLLSGGVLPPGATTAPKRWEFENVGRVRFSFNHIVYAAGEAPSVSIDQGLSVAELVVGADIYVAYVVNLSVDDETSYNTGPLSVSFEQTIAPDDGGIQISSSYPGGWSASTDFSWPVNEFIGGLFPGTYTVTSTATILETGASASTELVVTVSASGTGALELALPGVEPDGIMVDTAEDVFFTCFATGTDAPPATLSLEQVDENGNLLAVLGNILDDGTGGDLLAGDYVYGGTFPVGPAAEGTLYFRAVGLDAGQVVESSLRALAVTPFAPELDVSDLSLAVAWPDGTECLSNEVIVRFVEGTSSVEMEAVAAGISGVIVGTVPTLGLVQIHVPDTGTSVGVQNALDALEFEPLVEYAEPNCIVEGNAVTPSDSDYGNQWAPEKIRADEAWVLARGSVSIVAVLDSGVDYDHPDLDSKIIKGKNYLVQNSNDPKDDHGHGTHVSGIIAAETNNSQGIAGISWHSKILAVKVLDANGKGSWSHLASAIRYACDQGVKIINMSLGGSADVKGVRDAVAYAKKKNVLLVAAAGNVTTSTKEYPAAYPDVMAIGNTNDQDKRHQSPLDPTSGSTYGAWLSMAAPGEEIYSTMPTYPVTMTTTWPFYSQDYDSLTGTSMAAPQVAGAAAVLSALHPGWGATKLRERLEKSSQKITTDQPLGVGRLDLFEAVFNGSFEIGDLSEWSATGNVNSFAQWAVFDAKIKTPKTPLCDDAHGVRMGYLSTGPAGDQVAASIEKSFTVQAGVTSIPVQFEYNFVTEEYPEWVGSIYDDALEISLTAPNGTKTILAVESVNGSIFIPIGGFDMPGGDSTIGHTGWKTATVFVPVTQGPGKYTIQISDAGDDIYDSVVLIDHIRFKHDPTP